MPIDSILFCNDKYNVVETSMINIIRTVLQVNYLKDIIVEQQGYQAFKMQMSEILAKISEIRGKKRAAKSATEVLSLTRCK